MSSGLDPDAALVLIGGGAKGQAWRRVVGSLSGRPLEIPDASELVALGAAVQAAAILAGEAPVQVARRWGTRRGEAVAAVPSDEGALARIREASQAGARLLTR